MKKDQTHNCFISGCITQVNITRLMCNKHWKQVPDELQLNVIKTFAGWKKGDKVSRGKYLVARKNAKLWVERELSIG